MYDNYLIYLMILKIYVYYLLGFDQHFYMMLYIFIIFVEFSSPIFHPHFHRSHSMLAKPTPGSLNLVKHLVGNDKQNPESKLF